MCCVPIFLIVFLRKEKENENERKNRKQQPPTEYSASKHQKTVNLSDFALFLSVMRNREAYESVLSIILDEKDLTLEEVAVEHVILNDYGKRAIRLDAWARDSKNRQINTEMQNDTDSDDIRRRARFYQGLIDSPILKSGKETKYRELPATIIIFITQEDIFERDLAMYTFTEQCREIQGLELNDGTTKLFLNMKSKNGRPELVSLLQYMKETDIQNPEILVKDERIKKLDAIVTEVKEKEEWENMSMSIYKQGIEQGIAQGREQGLLYGRQEGILDLLQDYGPVDEELRQKIMTETDTETLRSWLKLAGRAGSIEAFQQNI